MKMHRLFALVFMFMLLVTITVPVSTKAATGLKPYVTFRKWTTNAAFAKDVAHHSAINIPLDGAADLTLASTGRLEGSDKKRYRIKVKSYQYGVFESKPIDSGSSFDTLIPSWNVETPAGTWMQVELQTSRDAAAWTAWYNMGVWASDTGTIERQSVNGQSDTNGYVSTDTLLMRGAATYKYYRYRITLFSKNQNTPRLHLLSVMTSDSYKEDEGYDIGDGGVARGRELEVPKRSQMIYKGGGEVWCSPTSTSMVLAYWEAQGALTNGGTAPSVPEAAAATYDYVYEGNGNWPFNTAWAATYGLEAYVTRMSSMTQVEEWINSGVPVIISYAFAAGELEGTPITSSAGHIMVVRGFDDAGNVIVNDPAAASDAAVRIVYDRDQLERLWLSHSGGTVYLIYPKGHTIPVNNAHGSW